MSLFLAKFNISAHQFASKDVQAIFKSFIGKSFYPIPKITEKILIQNNNKLLAVL